MPAIPIGSSPRRSPLSIRMAWPCGACPSASRVISGCNRVKPAFVSGVAPIAPALTLRPITSPGSCRHSQASCVDEVYQGRLAFLFAVDPAAPDGDRLVGYQLVQGDVDAAQVEQFLHQLRDAGIHPDQVITDGSAL